MKESCAAGHVGLKSSLLQALQCLHFAKTKGAELCFFLFASPLGLQPPLLRTIECRKATSATQDRTPPPPRCPPVPMPMPTRRAFQVMRSGSVLCAAKAWKQDPVSGDREQTSWLRDLRSPVLPRPGTCELQSKELRDGARGPVATPIRSH